MSEFEANLDRRDFITGLVGAAFGLTVAGCQDQKQELTPNEVVARLTTESSLIKSAQSHLGIGDVAVASAITDDQSGVLKELVKSYGMVLLLEEAEGSNRPLNVLQFRRTSDHAQPEAFMEIQVLVSGCASQILRNLERRVHDAVAERSLWGRWTSDSRNLRSVADSAEKLALKLDTFPKFTFAQSALVTLNNMVSGAPTQHDIQSLKEGLAAVIREQIEHSRR
jgi:hypothetical protein